MNLYGLYQIWDDLTEEAQEKYFDKILKELKNLSLDSKYEVIDSLTNLEEMDAFGTEGMSL